MDSPISGSPGESQGVGLGAKFFHRNCDTNEKGLHPTSQTEMTSNGAIKQAVEAGLGLAIVSLHTVELELSIGRLLILPVDTFPIKRKWYVAYRHGKRLSTTAEAFRQFVLEQGQIYESSRRHER